MNRHRLGIALLTVWTGFNLALAVGIVGAISLAGTLPPALPLFLSEPALSSASDEVLALFRSMGLLLNSGVAAASGMALALVWLGIRRGIPWAWWTTAVTLGWLQVGGFLADAPLGHPNLALNVVSAVVLVLGLAAAKPGEGGVEAQEDGRTRTLVSRR